MFGKNIEIAGIKFSTPARISCCTMKICVISSKGSSTATIIWLPYNNWKFLSFDLPEPKWPRRISWSIEHFRFPHGPFFVHEKHELFCSRINLPLDHQSFVVRVGKFSRTNFWTNQIAFKILENFLRNGRGLRSKMVRGNVSAGSLHGSLMSDIQCCLGLSDFSPRKGTRTDNGRTKII